MSIFDSLITQNAMLILMALVIELLVGWPPKVFDVIRHPVVWVGSLLSLLERYLNQSRMPPLLRNFTGALTAIIVICVTTAIALTLSALIPNNLPGLFIEAVIASSLLAARSLYTHVRDVFSPLAQNNVDDARAALAKIVGRDTKPLDEHGMAGAALETLAENASDGVIAPIFWGVLFGLPGVAAYKAINTLDSMIGHKTARYKDFGLFAARLDDVANWIPARLTALLIWCCTNIDSRTNQARTNITTISKQASQHRSPNAGWPESTMAFALGVRLSGPRLYETGMSNEPWLNEAGRKPTVNDLSNGLRLYSYALVLTGILLFGVAIVA